MVCGGFDPGTLCQLDSSSTQTESQPIIVQESTSVKPESLHGMRTQSRDALIECATTQAGEGHRSTQVRMMNITISFPITLPDLAGS